VASENVGWNEGAVKEGLMFLDEATQYPILDIAKGARKALERFLKWCRVNEARLCGEA
jgi:hypothetical protein